MKSRHVIVTKRGGPEVLRIVEEDVPQPGRGEALVRILAAGVSYADLLMREGVHLETPRTPFTPGWDLIGVVDRLGTGVSDLEPGQMVAAMPITGGYADFICLPKEELIPVPDGLDPAEAVCVVFNYATAYQMMHRLAHVTPNQRALIHSAAGGIGTALLQLGRLLSLDMYGTASQRNHAVVSALGGAPIDYRNLDFVKEIHRLTGDGVDVVFDGIGGAHLWRSREALRPGGKIVAYGFTSSLHGGQLASGRRYRLRGVATIAGHMGVGWLLPGRRRVLPYSIQWLKRLRSAWFREDVIALYDLLQKRKIEPLIAQRLPLTEVRRAHELLGKGGVTGKIVLLCDESSLASGEA